MSIASRLKFVVAGDSRDVIEKDCGKAAWRSLADNGFVERTSVSCVGFHREIEANSLLVVLPKAFNSPGARARLSEPAYEREQIYRLIRIFKKVRRETEFSLNGGKTNHILDRELRASDPVLDSFDAALRIRRDYRENGLYIRKSTRQTLNKPNLPVNWACTIRRATTLLSGQEIFFANTVHQSRNRDMSHPLCLLHIACLKEIFALTGERSDLEDTEALDTNTFRRVKANPRSYLRDLKASTFDERGRFLISAISSFLSESSMLGTERQVREELLSYTKDFEDIWEQVLRDLMAPNLTKRTLPAGEWYSWPDALASKGMQPMFDIRLENGDADVLVDAKDYRLLNGSKWQGSNGDHYKQIIYRQLLDAPSGSKVVNILAFPSLGQKSLFAIRGYHHWKEIEGSRVFEVTVDYDLAIKHWLRETSLDIKAEMATLLENLRQFSEKVAAPSVDYQVAFTRSETGWSLAPASITTPMRILESSLDTGKKGMPAARDLPGFVESPAAKDQLIDLVPVYSLEAAAGLWGPETTPEEIGWAEAPGIAIEPGMFIARVCGHSMEPKIKDGSWNLFRCCPAGSRKGRIVLVQFNSMGDPENGGRFTVKKYQSVKRVTEEDWKHEHIELVPLNRDYDPIIVTPHEATEMVVVGEWVSSIE